MKSARIHAASPAPLNVAILVLDDCNTLSLAAAVDPLRAANRLAPRRMFDWTYVTATGQPARLTSGLTVPGDPIARLEATDLLLVIAGFNLAAQSTPTLLASLRRIAATGATIGGIDGGPWVLASAGLLDGYRATTHWEDLESFAARFPAVTTLRDRFHVDGPRMTSGGATPAIDMMLHLIAARGGETLAARVAGAFIYDAAPDPSRAQRRAAARPNHSALTARASALMEDTLDAPLPMTEIARCLGTSPRALQAQFRARLNTTPQAHSLSLRLAEALRLVTDTNRSLTDIALATGFASQSSFARAFRAAHGRPARDFRKPLVSSL
ncbi:MAG: GlxA family transcriptional regulator [Pseudooceanicola sp.]|nr:GlxA family transcriptional regulator [Pseudooceanicola sp.]